VEEGLEAALQRKARTRPPPISFDGAFNARLTALACSPAPAGRARWTVRLLAEKIVELKIAPKGNYKKSPKGPPAWSTPRITSSCDSIPAGLAHVGAHPPVCF